MTDTSHTSALPRLSLRRAAALFVLVTVLLAGLAITLIFGNRSDDLVDQALDRAVTLRTTAAGEVVARAIQDDWQDLVFLSNMLATADEERITGIIEGLQGEGTRLSWVGYAGTDGIVRAASDGLLVGADVSQRPWFRNGLQNGFAGDVHEAVLLANALQKEGEEPLRFIDLAQPVRDADGSVVGVVAMHINMNWLVDTVRETGRIMAIDLFLINAAGDVIVAPEGTAPGAEELSLLRAARIGSSSATRATWPDGQDYFTSLVPSVTYGDLPSFGWRLAGRIESDSFRPGLSSLRSTVLIAAAVVVVIFAVMTVLFSLIVLQPFRVLATAARGLAEGRDPYLPEGGVTREAARIAWALARLQSGRPKSPDA
ncbi:cache domain-containing protein [Maritimibacter alkaliphilus]|uniref:cache domain-containing protein n=1 Tax=Maritimibacter alkaliphilus TaxID=404236 RepID=UPI001C96969E|nr:cache domain-containing protein [Maritimibacter alkaliphilus]MBY6090859.1 cache domain-containing protein [Maritimibacter alkaliphilus]